MNDHTGLEEPRTIDNTAFKVLIQKRGQIKSKLTRFKTYLDSFHLSEKPDLTQLKLRLSKLEECWSEFDNLQGNIELLHEDNISVETEERDIFESNYFSLFAQAQDFIDSFRKPSPQQPIVGENHSFEGNQTGLGLSVPQIRLPTINLPSFSGNYEDWLSFSDSFQSLIHNNETLSDIQKLHYLKSSLKGEASNVIQSIQLTSNNYIVAWELLEKRFKNISLIIQKHTRALFDLPTVQKDSASCLRILIDGVLSNLRALKALKQPTEHWDTLLIHLITSKLNQNTYRDWEMFRPSQPDTLPTLNDLIQFIQKRCHILETSSNNKTTHRFEQNTLTQKLNKTSCFTTQNPSCQYCEGNHAIFQCQAFIKATPSERWQKLKSAGLCFNCLKPGHMTKQCRSGNCKKCNGKHNTLLHFSADKSNSVNLSSEPRPQDNKQSRPQGDIVQHKPDNQPFSHSCTSNTLNSSSHILLSTAQVDVIGINGTVLRCRALLDNGSQSCLMTEGVAQHLRLPRKTERLQISGIHQSTIQTNGTTQAKIQSCVSNYQQALQFHIISKITGDLPSTSIDISNMKIPTNIILADPDFQHKGKIDLLLGQEIFFDLLCIGQIKTHGCPTLQKTKLGWIVGGKVDLEDSRNGPIHCNLTTTEKIDRQLQNFWMLEEPNKCQKHLTLEERTCEEHFAENTQRTTEGRYIVKMPLKTNACEELGDSKDLAVKRFLQVEKRLERDKNLRSEYNNFMNDYKSLGHMEKQGDLNEDVDGRGYFLPHHPVINTHSTTTRVRVVFDASASSTSGKSLNDIQLVGPKVQRDLFSILLNFRMHNYVMTADIEKMYRQILIDESQRELQKILWRSNPYEPIEIYKLNTVTYGISSAPYLSTKTLNQLAIDETENYPEAAKVLQKDFYVDDLLTGCSSIGEAQELQTQLIGLLKRGGFNLRKWNANSEILLAHLTDDCLQVKPQELLLDQDSATKILGLWWDSKTDEFQFRYTPTMRKSSNEATKRIILSDISKLYDPLGVLSPIIIRSKILLQEMWKLHLTWDESLPLHLHTKWNKFVSCLQNLTSLRLPRQMTLRSPDGTYDIHAFSDSSERAYGAVVYLRHEDNENNIRVSLMCSKSRVAPLHSTSLPRLELCAALLLAELVENVKSVLQVEIRSITYWTDSSVTLAWIKGEPARWKPFVANRVAKIQDLTRGQKWKHISSEDNPADLVSRGTSTKQLIDSQLWWHGPLWLRSVKTSWPQNHSFDGIELRDIPELKQSRVFILTNQEKSLVSRLLEEHSSIEKIRRIIAWIFRFIKNAKHEGTTETSKQLNFKELRSAEMIIIKQVQGEVFQQDIEKLKNNSANLSSNILSLDPFIDDYGILRVGGRIRKSSLSYDHIHQILLPKTHRVTNMIVNEEHKRQLHCGPQALLYSLRQKYWIINGREVVRKITHNCLKCFKAKPKLQEQKMSDLPADRVNLIRPFLHSGVDYCGPFLIKSSHTRKAKLEKSYVAVFVCLATKAVHLELVSSLTTAAFLAALKRFVSRRGKCSTMRSDNGKTFVGANRKLKELKNFFDRENEHITDAISREGIVWKFNPPYSPHTGGLWEAAVKSLKYHLTRVAAIASLTFEEFCTLLTQIEAVLNSRPLTPMSSDPSDMTCLTPAHFLVGDVLTTIPEPSSLNKAENRLTRWQRIQHLYQHFWNRWSKEYLTLLQTRNRWKKSSVSLKIGDLVLLKDDQLPPVNWPIGRILAVHPGLDGLVRTVTVRTPKHVTTRSVHKLCLLPIQE